MSIDAAEITTHDGTAIDRFLVDGRVRAVGAGGSPEPLGVITVAPSPGRSPRPARTHRALSTDRCPRTHWPSFVAAVRWHRYGRSWWSDFAAWTRPSCTWRHRPTTSTWLGRWSWTPAGAPGAGSPGRVSDLIRDRLHLVPTLRKRLADPRLGYTQPDWIDVDVDPADHCTVHRSADLEAVAAEVLARPLDRSRPLWEVHLVEGLGKGRTGMIMKLHHALLDGPSGAELMVQLLDFEPSGRADPGADDSADRRPHRPAAASSTGSPGDAPTGPRRVRRPRCATPPMC